MDKKRSGGFKPGAGKPRFPGKPGAENPKYPVKQGAAKPFAKPGAERPKFPVKQGDAKPFAKPGAERPKFPVRPGAAIPPAKRVEGAPVPPARKPEGKPAFEKKPFIKKTDHADKGPQPSVIDARRLALNALSDVVRAGSYATLALDKHLSKSHMSPEDKRLATSIFYAALENRIRIGYILGQLVEHMPEAIIEDILHIGAAQILFLDRVPDHAAVDEAVKQAKRLQREGFAPLINGALRSLIRKRDAREITFPDKEQFPLRHLSILHSLPEQLVKRIVDDYGMEEAEAIISFRPDEHLQTIRRNFLRGDEASFLQYAQKRHWELTPGVVPGAYRLSGAADLGGDEDFKKGRYSLISESSMLAAYAMEPKRGQTILDACAAPGGKSAMLCELMEDTGRVLAWDVHEHRVRLIQAQKERLRLDSLRPAARDASIHRDELDLTADAVLIDAPCSGLGVMLNKPDIKYRVSGEDIEQLAQLQKKILDACCAYVSVGGMLVYSTCTITKDENERQVSAFLERHPEFELDTDAAWLPDALKGRLENGLLQLQAHLDHMEGFFIARLRRVRA